MAVHGKGTKFFVNQYDLSGFLNSADIPRDVDTPEVTTFGNNDRKYITGLRNSTLSVSGFWSGTSSLAVDALSTLLGKTTGLNITYAPQGLGSTGKITYSVQAIKTNYTATSPVDGAAAVSIDFQGNDVVSRGIALTTLTARTSDGNAGPYNLTANTSAGARAYLHATAVSLASTERIAITVQDSATCSAGSWTDLVTFDAITCSSPTHQRKTVTGNVDQYVRAEWARASTEYTFSSVTFTIAFEQI
jgi:hypothetical protein